MKIQQEINRSGIFVRDDLGIPLRRIGLITVIDCYG